MNPRTLVSVVLAAILLLHGWQAVFHPDTRPFSTALAVAAAVLLAIVSLGRFDWTPPKPVRSDASRRRGRNIALVSGVALAGVVLLVPWSPANEFDLSGFLFFLENAHLLLIAFAALGGVVYGLLEWKR